MDLHAIIRLYLARVREALALFQQHRGLDATAVWRWHEHGLEQTGAIDEAGAFPYFFHGTGATVHLPDGPVTWDFGSDGRFDGFTAARMATDAKQVQVLLDEAKARGEVEQHDDLYYLR